MPGVWVYHRGATAELPVTRWRIVGIPELPGTDLAVVLIADTVAPVVIEAIERAARATGVELRRLEEDE
jgi:hypothetical protein